MSIPKYPRTPYWPWSPSVAKGDRTHEDPEFFLNKQIVITEKLDGSNTAIHRGEVYNRSTSEPSNNKWNGMVKKHHAWKVTASDLVVYGENVYPVHSIEYNPLKEEETFYLFAAGDRDNFCSFDVLTLFADIHGIPHVPVLFEGEFDSLDFMQEFIDEKMTEKSVLGSEREGIVIRTYKGYKVSNHSRHACKVVRPNHVQTDEHWTQQWKSCELIS